MDAPRLVRRVGRARRRRWTASCCTAVHPESLRGGDRGAVRARRRVHSTPTRRRCRTRGRRRCARPAARPRWSTRCWAGPRARGRLGAAAARPPRRAASGRWGSASSATSRSRRERARRRTASQRVLILDWDVHHGNGTEAIFAADPDVLFISIHEWPLYPGTGPASYVGDGSGGGLHGQPAGARRARGDAGVPLAGRARRGAADRAVGAAAGARLGGVRRPPRRPAGHLHGDRGGLRGHDRVAAAGGDAVGAPLGLVLEGGYDLGALAGSMAALMPVLVGRRSAGRRGRSSGIRSPTRRWRGSRTWWPGLGALSGRRYGART